MKAALVPICAGFLLAVVVSVGAVKAPFMFQLFSEFESESTPTNARNLRASARYHFTRANEAQNMMFKAQDNDDVDGYETWLQIMRDEDEKMNRDGNKYEELRDYLEAKIRMGEMEIEGFENRYDKDTLASIIDLMTFRARH